MTTSLQPTPTSHLRMAHARVDITPPVGIYHPMWGAARHHRATGIHRPLFADILLFAPLSGATSPWLQAQLDMVYLDAQDHGAVRQALAEGSGVDPDQVVVACSHTHAGGFFSPDRAGLPGGELIAPYLAEVKTKLRAAAQVAAIGLTEVFLTYGVGHSSMASNRDYWDEARGLYACGFNPDAPADDTVLVARATAADGRLLATVVNYACHPTTLAWENTLVSPDYVGALRAGVERATGAPCVFTLGACGDLGPRQGFTGDTAVADRNGRQVAYAALAALEAMDPPAHDFAYQGPVVSGATLGTWAHTAQSGERAASVQHLAGGTYTVDLPLKPRPEPAQLEQDLATWQERQAAADAAGDAIAARDYGARAERARRWLQRLRIVPPGPSYPFHFSVRRQGDAFWVSTGAEPYNLLQTTLRSRFPSYPIVVTALAGEPGVAYLLPQDRYGKGLYQEEPSSLGPGCLEQLADAMAARIRELAEL